MMNLLKRFCAVIYLILMVAVGGVLISIGLRICNPDLCLALADEMVKGVSGQIIFIFIGGIVFMTGVIVPYRIEKKLQKRRTVRFQNPDGEVMVSLCAIEDYVRKIAKSIPEIKDIKSSVDISRKGIDITAAVAISAGANIQKITEKIQMEVKNKIQVMLGGEETLNIKIFVKKIARQDSRDASEKNESRDETAIPYREAG